MKKLYEDNYQKGSSFSFGSNWLEFTKNIKKKNIDDSVKSLETFLDLNTLKGKTFLDVGCGSGLFSMAALKMGARRVVSLDIDKNSIHCTLELISKYKYTNRSEIVLGSVLDKAKIKSLGTYDVVYAWGSLHHTGAMWQALENTIMKVNDKGLLYLAIYNDFSGANSIIAGSSSFWLGVKRLYGMIPDFGKSLLEILYVAYFVLGYLLTFRNPFSYLNNFSKREKGMNFMTNVHDWLGGYPYEYATVDELINFCGLRGLAVKRIKSSNNLGCHELLLVRV